MDEINFNVVIIGGPRNKILEIENLFKIQNMKTTLL